MHSLKARYKNKVKLIYIDPPYYFKDSKKEDSFKYNTNFKLSSWLIFMKDRLKIARELLIDDGFIFVQINNSSLPYLNVLMDEVFGEEKFVELITVKVKGASGVSAGSKFIFDSSEYIIVYKKVDDIQLPKGFKIDKEIVDKGTQTANDYSMILNRINLDNKELVNTIEKKDQVIHIYKLDKSYYDISNIDKSLQNKQYYVDNFDNIFQLVSMSGGTEKQVLEKIPDNELYIYEYTPIQGKNKGNPIQNFVYNNRQIGFLKDSSFVSKNFVIKQEYLTNIWNDNWYQGIAKEGGVSFKNGKKPEKLLERIISLATQPGDLVLDFFVGSGTTCAVAHKMGRRWIGVEQMNYGENDSIVRLKNVLNGEQGGISKSINWKGGGNFITCEMAKWNQTYIDDILKATSTEELLKVWEVMQKESFLVYQVEIKEVNHNIETFKDLTLEEQKDFLIRILDKNHLYVNYSEAEDKTYKLSQEDIKITGHFYGK